MIKLLRFEWRKLWRQKSLYICFSIGLLLAALFIILGKVLTERFGLPFGSATESLLVMLPRSGFISLLGIYLAIFVCSDYSQHTIKNIYARGYSRTSVYLAKYLISLLVTLVVALVYWVFSLLFSLMLGAGVTGLTGVQWGSLALQLWVVVGLHGLYFGIAMLLGKTGGSVAINLFGIGLVFSILALLLSIFDIDFNIYDYDLESMLEALAGNKLNTGMVVRGLILPIVYAGIFNALGWWVSRRREV